MDAAAGAAEMRMIMAHCKDCIHFNVREAFGKTVKFPVDDGVCLYFAKDTNVTTNADRIRAMSDEELAKAIASKAYTGACNDFDISYDGNCCHNCEKCDAIIKWLQQPVE